MPQLIIQSLFKQKDTTILPIHGYEDLTSVYMDMLREQDTQFGTVLMINCGASIDIITEFRLEELTMDVIILDSHRPYHPANILHNRVAIMDDSFNSESAEDKIAQANLYKEVTPMDADEDSGDELEHKKGSLATHESSYHGFTSGKELALSPTNK